MQQILCFRVKMLISICLIAFMLCSLFFPLSHLSYLTKADDPEAFTVKWTTTTGLNGYIGPVTRDIDGDGIHEIFVAGLSNSALGYQFREGKVVCINGVTGSIVWEHIFSSSYVDWHVPVSIADLDNDGTYEIVFVNNTRTVALNAEDGSTFWNVAARSGWHQFVIADVDGSGLPYVYVADHSTTVGVSKISKIRGYDGTVVAQADHWYSCYGGISAADVDGQGTYIFAVSDRNSGTGAKGARFYDKDLNLIFNDLGPWCSSHCISFVDIDGDGILEAVALRQSSSGSETGGIYVWKWNTDTQTYARYPGKYSNNLGLGTHVQPAIYDIDGDGSLELVTCYATYAKLWDLGSWSLDATLTDITAWEPPDFANVIGNPNLEIILCRGSGVRIYDSSYSLVDTIITDAYASVVQDIDDDGLNELLLLRNNTLRVYDTLAEAPTPRVRTDTPYYSERRTGAGVYVAPLGGEVSENSAPYTPSSPSPANGATSQSITVDLSWTGGDPDDGDTVTYDVYFGSSNPPSKIVSNQSGTSYDPGTLSYNTIYYWKIVSWDEDGESAVGSIWQFTTVNRAPNTPSSPSPSNGATSQSITVDLSWTGGDPDAGDTVTYDVYFGFTFPLSKKSTNQSLTSYEPGTLYYGCEYYWQIVSWDNHGASAVGSIWSFETVGIADTTSPDIASVEVLSSSPLDTNSDFGWENITCTVADNIAVSCVYLSMTCPNSSNINVSMINKAGSDEYYYNTTLILLGNYSYYIWACDTSGNGKKSSVSSYSKPPNWDINNDGRCSILDQVLISLQYGATGSAGWIGEDVDNNGQIQILDLLLLSNHFGETWWT